MKTKTQKIVMAALFAALTCVATFSIRIPIVATNGYIHPGDAIVVLTGLLLGPVYGFMAAGIGSALADALGGYWLYVPVTFFVKGIIATVVYFVYTKLLKGVKSYIIKMVITCIFSTTIVVVGYFAFEFLIYGKAAIASIGPNIFQGVSGVVFATLLMPFLSKTKMFTDNE